MSIAEKDMYFVAVKVFLVNDGKLLVMKDNFGDWDLPGGRIKKDEFHTPLAAVIERKMKQEVGDKARYTIQEPIVFLRHERNEAVPGNPLVRIFAVGYAATLDGGEVTLSPRHTEMQWVDIKTYKPEQHFTGGWLEGVQEYLDLARSKL
jgi:ADP-ribose pyrophosphatase YjhB (NUDIX family)